MLTTWLILEMMRLAVGSTNPVKVNSAKSGIAHALGKEQDIECEGFPVESTVPDQPFGLTQTKQGAKDRAVNAWSAYIAKHGSAPHYSVGMEGGIIEDKDKVMHCIACISLYNGVVFGNANTASFPLPTAISKLVHEGLELGDADDKVFNTVNSKQGDGTVGKLTRGVINRTVYYEHAVVLAFARFNFPQLYDTDPHHTPTAPLSPAIGTNIWIDVFFVFVVVTITYLIFI